MKKLLLYLCLALGTMLGASAQNTIDITLKNGTVLTIPANTITGTTYTTQATASSMSVNDEFSVSCLAQVEQATLYQAGDSTVFFTFSMSDRLRQNFLSFEDVTLSNVKTNRDISIYAGAFGLQGWLYTGSFLWWANQLCDLEPVNQPLTFTFTARFAEGPFSFTKTASCTVGYKPDTQPVEDAYYLACASNRWQLVELGRKSGSKYDGQPYTCQLIAPRAEDRRIDEALRIVPASALSADGFDRSRSLGVADSTVFYSDNDRLSYSCQMAAGADKQDIVLKASDGADIYTVSFYPSYGYVTIDCVDGKAFYESSYWSLGFGNAQRNANGSNDIEGWDSGNTSLVRQLVNLNELTTDHLLCPWLDNGIAELNTNQWTNATPQVEGIYLRLQKSVEYCNTYLAIGTDQQKLAEVRFLRAYFNSQLLDLFGQVPVYIDMDTVNPPCMARADLFNYLVSEITTCMDDLPTPHVHTEGDADYGHVDQAAAWMLLARLYLNAEVYTGTAHWAEAADYAKRIVNSGAYSLFTTSNNGWTAYQQLFMGDNGTNGATCEALMVIPYHGTTATSWNQLFLLAAAIDYDMAPVFSISEGWNGLYARPDFVKKFFPAGDAPHANAEVTTSVAGDQRALLWGEGRMLDATTTNNYYDGYAITKYNNHYANGGTPSHYQFPDFDIFLMRYAEAVLTLAEAEMRLGDNAYATTLINQLRQRAGARQQSMYSLNDVLDEWSREFYLEGRRRTDLIRFGQYGGQTAYQWRWKGGVYNGTAFDSYRNVFPLPQSVLSSNPNAQQNPGY